MKNANVTVDEAVAQTGNTAYVDESFEPEVISDADGGELETMDEENDDADSHVAISSTTAEVSTESEEVAFAGSENGTETEEADIEDELEVMEGFDESVLEMDRESTAEAEDFDDSKLLDAYFAEFGDPATAALLKQRPELSDSVQEVVIGRDDRIRVGNTRRYPFRCICSLRITAKDGSQWIGTGWLAGPRLVVTAGHCVYLHSRGGWAKSIEVIPGRNGRTFPYGSCKSSSFYSVKGWTRSKKRSHDYGAIVLPSNCKYGNRLGYFGFGSYSFFTLLGLKVNLSGYPGDKPSGTQWWHCRRIKFVTPRTLVYNIDTAGGQSGSPVWWLRNGKRYAVGIHTNGSWAGNSATRITSAVFKNIRRWKNAHR